MTRKPKNNMNQDFLGIDDSRQVVENREKLRRL